MKTLIVLVVGLLAVGCVTVKDNGVHLGIGQPSNTKAESVKELTPEEQKSFRDSVVGEYAFKENNGHTWKQVLLENGTVDWYQNGKGFYNGKWSIVNGEVRINDAGGGMYIWRINKDKSLTWIPFWRGDPLPSGMTNSFGKIK